MLKKKKELVCWWRSSRGRDQLLTLKPDLGNQRPLIPSPILGMYLQSTILKAGAVFKDTALRQ